MIERGSSYGFIAGSNSNRYFFMIRDLKPGPDRKRPRVDVGTRTSFLVAPVNEIDHHGRKKCDQAIDIEVL